MTIHLGAGDGTYAFAGLPPGTYCVSDGNDAILIPGGLSYPIRGGEPQITITLGPGEHEAVDFGWTYPFGD